MQDLKVKDDREAILYYLESWTRMLMIITLQICYDVFYLDAIYP